MDKQAAGLIARGQDMMAKVQEMKDWAIANYDNGASQIVECWADGDYHDVLAQEDFDVHKAIAFLAELSAK